MSDLMRLLTESGTEHTEYALHVSWPNGDAEDWMTCETLERLQSRIDYWAGKGLICTPLQRMVTKTGWQAL